MSDRIHNQKIQGLIQQRTVPGAKKQTQNGPEFAALLNRELDLKVSGHAQTRLNSRGIELGKEDWARVRDGVDRAAAKGSRESLVMMDDVALVVSVKNRTVITAVSKEQLRENVFTNIDSAVFV